MKREKLVSVTLTLEEWKELRKKMRQAEDEEDKWYTVSSYIRSKLVLPHLNGDSPPSVQESEQENVCNSLLDTFEKQSKEFEFNLD